MSTIKKFLSDTVIYGVTTIVSRMLNFLMTPIFIAKFSAAKYGIFTTLFSYASMINAILAFGMETTYFRFLQKVERQDQHKVFNSSFFVTIITAVVFLVSVFTFSGAIASWFTAEKPAEYQDYVAYVKLFGVILTADALAIVPFAKLRAQGRPLRYAALKLINILFLVGFNLFFLYVLPQWSIKYAFWHAMAEGWFTDGWIGNVFIANMLASVITLILLLPQIVSFRLTIDSQLIKSMLYYTFPILIANISFIINENLDKMMLPKLLPVEQGDIHNGIYGAVSKIAIFLSLIVTAFRLGAEPFFFSYANNENARKVYATIMEYFTILMVICMVGICANMDWLKNFIKGADAVEQQLFWSGLFIVPLLLFNYVLLGIYINLSVWYKLSDQTKYGLYISGLGAVITIILNLVLIPQYSYVGAAMSTTVTYTLMITLSYFWGQKNYTIPYNTGKIMSYLFLSAFACWLISSPLQYNFWWGNLLWLMFLGAIFLLEKKSIVRFINNR